MSALNLEQKVIAYLSDKTEPVPTLTIAKAVVGSSAKASDINATLYTLQKANQVTKIAEANGSKPRWSLGMSTPEIKAVTTHNLEEIVDSLARTKIDDLTEAILDQLVNNQDGLTALEIAKLIPESNGNTKIINPYLYKLKSNGKVNLDYKEGSTRPIWTIKPNIVASQ